jgi:hypothetical protein
MIDRSEQILGMFVAVSKLAQTPSKPHDRVNDPVKQSNLQHLRSSLGSHLITVLPQLAALFMDDQQFPVCTSCYTVPGPSSGLVLVTQQPTQALIQGECCDH